MRKIYLAITAIILATAVQAQTYLSKDFNDSDVNSGGWTNNLVVGVDTFFIGTFGGETFAKATNYHGTATGNLAAEVWLISPAVDLSLSSVPMLSFDSETNYAGDMMEVYVSTDYNGTADPNTQGTWTLLNPILPTSTTAWSGMTASGNVDLTAHRGAATYIAFKYVGTNSDGKTWEVDNILIIETSTGPSITASATDATCGNSDGSVTVTINSGTTPYTYLWSNGSTSDVVSGLTAGSYVVTVTDAGGSSIASATVGYSNGPTVTVTETATSCYGTADGSLAVTAGGQTDYTYMWEGGQTGNSATGLSAGAYDYTVTDASSCFSTGTANVTEPTAINVTATTTNETAVGAMDGSATASATGGNGVYTYAWQGGSTGASLTGVATGTYGITVMDGNGCIGTSSILVGSDYLPLTPIYDIQFTTAGNGDSPFDGMEVMTKGVVSGYCTYDHPSGSRNYRGYFIQDGDSAWSGLYVNDTVNYTNVSAGDTVLVVGTVRENDYPYWDYTVLREISSFTVLGSGPEPTPVALSTVQVNEEKWEGVLVSTTNVVVTDLTDIAFGSWSVDDNSGPTVVDNLMYWISPNPALGEVYDVTGVMFSEFNDIMIEPRKPSDVSFISVSVTPSPPVVSTSVTSQSTCGNSDGSASASATAGTTPYSYAWSSGSNSANATGLAQGTYTVTVTDGASLSATATVIISNSNGPAVTVSTVDVTCNGGMDGSATATGGGSSFTYEWDNGSATTTATGLSAGAHTCTVTDGGCSTIESFTVGGPSPIMVSAVTTLESGVGASDGAATASATGGNGGAYTYLWEDGTNGATISGVPTGDYDITVSDVLGCTTEETIHIGTMAVTITPISKIQYTTAANGDSPFDGIEIMTRGVVTGYCTYDHPSGSRNYRGYFIQDGDSAWSGIYVNDTVNYNTVFAGDTVEVIGTVRENDYPYWDYTVLREITSFTVVSTGGPEPSPVAVTTLDANNEEWEGVLVSVSNVEVIDVTDISFGSWGVDDNSGTVTVDNLMYWHSPDPQLGEKYNVAGVMFSEFNDVLLEPRKPSDVTFLGVGIESTERNIVARVYPNPSNGILIIETEVKGIVTISNALGQTISQEVINGNTTIDLTGQSKGIYFIELQAEGSTFVEKIVIK